MRILYILGVILLSFSLFIGGWIFMTQRSIASSGFPYSYNITNRSQNINLKAGGLGLLVVTFENTGTAKWLASELELHTTYMEGTTGRSSYFATNDWLNNNSIVKINPTGDDTTVSVRPGKSINFYIPIQVPENAQNAIYKEEFKLYLGDTPMIGQTLHWMIQVGNELMYQSASDEHIQIWLDNQRLWIVENNVVVFNIPISSGKAGYWTPKGTYTVMNHIPNAYSGSYNLWMDNWMALKSTIYGYKGYGLHKLPYWKIGQGDRIEGEIKNGRLYTNGRLYEDYSHLGKAMSHGCVRLGLDASGILYNWAIDGTQVVIS